MHFVRDLLGVGQLRYNKAVWILFTFRNPWFRILSKRTSSMDYMIVWLYDCLDISIRKRTNELEYILEM